MKKTSRVSYIDPKTSPGSTSPNILCFHKATNRLTFGSTNYSPRRLMSLLQHLADTGFRFGSLSEVVNEPDPEALALTFDDGYAHLFDLLPRIVSQFSVKPTVFVPTECIGQTNNWDYSSIFTKERHLASAQIKELSSQGVEFASHGHSHADLTAMTGQQIAAEGERSKKTLEDLCGTEVQHISYPFGRVDDRVKTTLSDCGYRGGFTMAFPRITDDPMAMGRYAVYGLDTQTSVLRKLRPSRLQWFERSKNRLFNKMSYGTILVNRLRDKDRNR